MDWITIKVRLEQTAVALELRVAETTDMPQTEPLAPPAKPQEQPAPLPAPAPRPEPRREPDPFHPDWPETRPTPEPKARVRR